MDTVAATEPKPRRTKPPRPAPRQGPVGRLHPVGAARTARRWQRLFLYVKPEGTRSWIQRLVVRGRRRELGLGVGGAGRQAGVRVPGMTAGRSAEVRLATWGRDGRGRPGVDDIGGADEGEAGALGSAPRASGGGSRRGAGARRRRSRVPDAERAAGRIVDAAEDAPDGIRSSFRNWAAEKTDHPRELIQAALAHVPNKVEAAYARSDRFERRRLLMDDWSDYLSGHAEDWSRRGYDAAAENHPVGLRVIRTATSAT